MQDLNLLKSFNKDRTMDYASALENIPIGIIALDLQRQVRIFNRTASEIFGIIPVNLKSCYLEEILDNDSVTLLNALYYNTLENSSSQNNRIVFKEEKRKGFTVHVQSLPWKDTDEEICGVLFLCHKYSNIETIACTNKAEEIKAHLVSSFSHDLLTPATAIKSFAELLIHEEGKYYEQRQEILHIILNESTRLTNLISDMLELSKIEAGYGKFTLDVMKISEVILLAIDALKPSENALKMKIKYVPPENEPYIVADRDKLIKVIMNILNEVQKVFDSDVQVQIFQEFLEGKRQRDFSDFVKVGIRIILSPRATEVFDSNFIYNTRPSISLSKEIVKRLGGNLWLKKEDGAKFSYFFTLPIIKNPDMSKVKPAENCGRGSVAMDQARTKSMPKFNEMETWQLQKKSY